MEELKIGGISLTIKQIRSLVVLFMKSRANPHWEILSITNTGAGSDTISLAPPSDRDTVRLVHYAKISHNDTLNRVIAYNWLDKKTVRRSIKASSLSAGTSLLLLPADIEFPVICYPTSTLELSASALALGKALSGSVLVSDLQFR